MKLLAIRLSWQTTPAKSLVIRGHDDLFSASTTAQLIQRVIHLAWPVLVAEFALMANAVIDTAMAGRLSALGLAPVDISNRFISAAPPNRYRSLRTLRQLNCRAPS